MGEIKDWKRSLRSRAARCAALIDAGAPDFIVFNEVKLINDVFAHWAAENGLDVTVAWYEGHNEPRKSH